MWIRVLHSRSSDIRPPFSPVGSTLELIVKFVFLTDRRPKSFFSLTFRLLPLSKKARGRLRERAKRDEPDSGDGSGNVPGAGLDPTGSGHLSRRVWGLWLARLIESDSRQILTYFFDSVGLWTASTSDSVVGLCLFRQRGIWTLDSVDFATAWTFSVEMSGSSCLASGQLTPTTTPSSCSFTSLSRKIIKSKSQWTQRTYKKLMHTTTTSTRRTCSCM